MTEDQSYNLLFNNPETLEQFSIFGNMESIQYIRGLLESIDLETPDALNCHRLNHAD